MRQILLAKTAVLLALATVVGCKEPNTRRMNPGDFYAARLATTMPNSQTPATGPSLSSGQYMIVGSVVAEANGRPIYANRILAKLEKNLAGEARKQPADRFRVIAADLIHKGISDEINNELEYAAADRNSTQEDHQMADAMTADWRQQQITQAGGSLAVVRKKFADSEGDFDDAVEQQRRLNLLRIYYHRKVMPRIAISADDIRRYYQEQLAKEFTVTEAVRYREIRIDITRTGSREAALTKVTDLRRRVTEGNEDFAVLAGQVNDDPGLMEKKGLYDWAPRGGRQSQKLEAEIWRLQPGQVGQIVEDNNCFYLIKIEEHRDGKVLPFEDQQTQEKIREVLSAQQLKVFRENEQKRLRKAAEESAIIRGDKEMEKLAVEMAMQKYPRWAAAN